jgi:calpain-15
LKSGIRLIKLRNPWGSFEWKGDWGDESSLWKKHPTIKLEMGQFDFFGSKVDADDGCFYMSWDDFLKHFDGIDVCYIQRDMSSLKLDIIEEAHVCGAFVGCIVGKILHLLVCL